jgi:cell filamentation protein
MTSRTCEQSTVTSSKTSTSGLAIYVPSELKKETNPSVHQAASASQPMDHVAAEIHRLRQLRDVPEADLIRTIAYLYDYTNFAHPFREGNGRATREFFDLLLSERGVGIDWRKTDSAELHSACHVARADSDLASLIAMFEKIVDTDPAYDF